MEIRSDQDDANEKETKELGVKEIMIIIYYHLLVLDYRGFEHFEGSTSFCVWWLGDKNQTWRLIATSEKRLFTATVLSV